MGRCAAGISCDADEAPSVGPSTCLSPVHNLGPNSLFISFAFFVFAFVFLRKACQMVFWYIGHQTPELSSPLLHESRAVASVWDCGYGSVLRALPTGTF